MKKAFGAFALAAMLFFTACGGKKADMDDPKSVAKYTCDKTKEIMSLLEGGDEKKISAVSDEVETFVKELEAHHGTKYAEFEAKVETEMKTLCPDGL
jgi:translation initiation factor 2 alpha subunit (eIF-2alpha)